MVYIFRRFFVLYLFTNFRLFFYRFAFQTNSSSRWCGFGVRCFLYGCEKMQKTRHFKDLNFIPYLFCICIIYYMWLRQLPFGGQALRSAIKFKNLSTDMLPLLKSAEKCRIFPSLSWSFGRLRFNCAFGTADKRLRKALTLLNSNNFKQSTKLNIFDRLGKARFAFAWSDSEDEVVRIFTSATESAFLRFCVR